MAMLPLSQTTRNEFRKNQSAVVHFRSKSANQFDSSHLGEIPSSFRTRAKVSPTPLRSVSNRADCSLNNHLEPPFINHDEQSPHCDHRGRGRF